MVLQLMDRLIITPDNALALNQAFENLVRSVFSLHKITMELTPYSPATGNFQNELEEYCRELQRNTKIPVQFSAMGLDRIPESGFRRSTAYRIIQHLLYTAIRSPQADRIDLDLEFDNSTLVIRLTGNNNWLNPGSLEIQGGKYWREMQTLIKRNNGSMNWDNSIDPMSRITVYFPGIS